MGPYQYPDLLGKYLVLRDVGNVGNSTSLLTGPEEKREFISCGEVPLLKYPS